MHVLLFINVVEICQGLFDTYLNKMDKLNSKGVFSRAANISRIKGSLIAEANKALNVHRLRQRILHDFKVFNSQTPMTRKSAGGQLLNHFCVKCAPSQRSVLIQSILITKNFELTIAIGF